LPMSLPRCGSRPAMTCRSRSEAGGTASPDSGHVTTAW
jgi:hypothetical protein